MQRNGMEKDMTLPSSWEHLSFSRALLNSPDSKRIRQTQQQTWRRNARRQQQKMVVVLEILRLGYMTDSPWLWGFR